MQQSAIHDNDVAWDLKDFSQTNTWWRGVLPLGERRAENAHLYTYIFFNIHIYINREINK